MTNTNIIILAAGKGSRMCSAQPKVLHKLAGRSMLAHVVAATETIAEAKRIIVTGHGAEMVEQEFANAGHIFVQQKEQLGTAHAVHMAAPYLCDQANVLILYGDVPLILSSTIADILNAVTDQSIGLLTINVDKPDGYGRIVRDQDGAIASIIEQKDATAEQLEITEVNTGVIALRASQLRAWLPKITNIMLRESII